MTRICLIVKQRPGTTFFFSTSSTIAHAATAPSPPGARTRLVFQAQFFALLFPFNSLLKAVTLLFHRSIFGSDDIGMACAVGAVAVVARKGLEAGSQRRDSGMYDLPKVV